MKNEFDLLNDIKVEVDDIEEVKLSKEEKEKINNRVKKKVKKGKNTNKRLIAVAALLFVLLGSTALSNETVIAKVSKIGKEIESFFGKEEESLRVYKNQILKSVEDKGIKFMLHEAILDDEELYISASIDYNGFDKSTLETKYDGDPKIVPYKEEPKFEIYLNGEKLEISGSGGTYEYNEDNTVDILLTVDMENSDLDEIYDVKLSIDNMEAQLGAKKNENIEGKWNIDFQINGKEMLDEVKVIDINKQIELEYENDIMSIDVNQIRITPASMRFKYEYNNGGKERDINLGFEFIDENNNKIEFVSQGGNEKGFSYKYMINKDIKTVKAIPIIYEHNILGDKIEKFEDKAIEIEINK